MSQLTKRLHEVFRLQGDDVALVYREKQVTYSELGASTEVIARRLYPMVSVESNLVAVLLRPSPEFIASILGVLKVGASYLPLNYDSPVAYNSKLLSESQATALICSKEFSAHVEKFAGDVIWIEDIVQQTPGELSAWVDEAVTDSSRACVIYTSGSTGQPKAAEISHCALYNSTMARVEFYPKLERIPLVYALNVDVATGSIFWALLEGQQLVINPHKLSDVGSAIELLKKEKITHIIYPSALYAPFLERAEGENFPDLKNVMIGGDRWPEILVQRHSKIIPNASLYNEYGPTEACVWSSAKKVYDGASKETASLTIGRPILNTSYHLSDEGELYIGGANLATGYLRDDEMTIRKFIRAENGERRYRTGDLVRINAEGEYVFLSRVDRQLKIAGNRVEAGEIENAILATGGYAACFATLSSGILVAYVMTKNLDAENLRKNLSARLPIHMVPTRFVAVEKFEYTAAGKIDEKMLPIPTTVAVLDEQVSPTESKTKEIISGIMELEHLSLDTRINEEGANSLTFVRISAQLKKAFQVDIPLTVMFADPTIRSIAKWVNAAGKIELPEYKIAETLGDTFPLSFQQKQIWFLYQLAPTGRAYNAQFSLNLRGPIDVTALKTALDQIIERHEILRTVFAEQNGEPVQVVMDPWQCEIDFVDLSQFDGIEQQARLDRLMKAAMMHNFDFSELPLVQWKLYRLSAEHHILFQIEHHFVHDGWSVSIFLREIRDFYLAALKRSALEIEPLATQYRDFVSFQQRWMQTPEFEKQVNYWTEKLQGTKDGVTFPTDRERVITQTFDGKCIREQIPADLVEDLLGLSRKTNTTLFSIFLSVFALVAWKYTGEEDVVIGSAFSNRRLPEAQNLIGMFVNALPLRIQLRPDMQVGEFVALNLKTLFEAQDHQELPLVELVKNLEVSRDFRKNPLFQLMFAFHDSPMPEFRMGDLFGRFRIEHNGSAKNDTNVVCMPNRPEPGSDLKHNGFTIVWEYNSGLYDEETIRYILDNFKDALSQMQAAWSTPISNLALLSGKEKSEILHYAKGPISKVPYRTVIEAIEDSISSNAQKVAMLNGSSKMTYLEVSHFADRIAMKIKLHSAPETRLIGLALVRSPEVLSAYVALMRNQLAYVPLDYLQPIERLRQIISDSRITHVLCSNALAPKMRDAGLVPIVVEDSAESITAISRTSSQRLADGEDLAYVIYTSGTTGVPKGIKVSNSNVLSAVQARTQFFGLTQPKTLVTLPLHFDVAPSMIFWTLWMGGTVVLPEEAETQDPAKILRLIQRHEVSHCNFVASFYSQLLAATNDEFGPSLRVVAIGGEPCSHETVRNHALKNKHVGLFNEYGPTEATVWCSATSVYTPDQGVKQKITIGRPLANSEMYILDPRDRVQPFGSVGEIAIGGAGVSLGYLNSEHTKNKFVRSDLGRIYRTGDLGRMNRNGEFEILGRIDEQVKVRGYRIELGEIKNAILSFESVVDAFVAATTSGGHTKIEAWISRSGGERSVRDLKDHLAKRLPDYMMPSAFMFLDKLPLTQAGKIDRSKLPSIHQVAGIRALAEKPRTNVEKGLASIWTQLLGLNEPTLDDDFFDAGGDSLLAIRATVLGRRLNVGFTVAELLEFSTIRKLATCLRPDGTPAPAFPKQAAGSTATLLPVQKWFFDLELSKPHHFNQSRSFKIESGLDFSKIRSALNTVIARHDAFRTVFAKNGAQWVSMLADISVESEIDQIAVTNLAELTSALSEFKTSLDFEAGPLCKFVLASRKDVAERYLFVTMHHLIVDAVSWDLLQDEIEDVLQSIENGVAPAARNAPSTFSLSSPTADERRFDELGFKSGVRPEINAGPNTFGGFKRISILLSERATRFITQDSRKYFGASAQAVLMAKLYETIVEWTGGTEVSICTESHGRDAQSTNLVGWLTRIYATVLRSSDSRAIQDELDRQLVLVTKDVLPDIMFNYLGFKPEVRATVRSLTSTRLESGPDISPDNRLPSKLDITIRQCGGNLEILWGYGSGLFTKSTMERLARQFVSKLELLTEVVKLAPSTAEKNLFLIHPVGGSVDWYIPLAKTLAQSTQCFGVVQTDLSLMSVEAMAASYLAKIKQVRGNGPYHISGWSFGAIVAFEICRLLRESGETVLPLVLIDPPMIFSKKEFSLDIAKQIASLIPGVDLADIHSSVQAGTSAEKFWTDLKLDNWIGDAETKTFMLAALQRLLVNYRALQSYEVRGALSDIRIAYSDDAVERRLTEEEFWAGSSENSIRNITVPGGHEGMLSGKGCGMLSEFLKKPVQYGI